MGTIEPFNRTPAPVNLAAGKTWHETGSHALPNGACCHCGPANHRTGPRYACAHREAV